jgi:hypothetical protein
MRLWNWNTKPTVVARYSAASHPSRASPSTMIRPESGRSSAPMRFSRVLFPLPDGLERRVLERADPAVLERLAHMFDDDLGAAQRGCTQ